MENTVVLPTTETVYLKFNNQDELTNLIEDLIAIENGSKVGTKSSVMLKYADGFTSIADLEQQQRLQTKSGTTSGIEEMTADEYNAMKAKSLIPDDVLKSILDTTLRIGVGNDLYKITSYGTLVTPQNNKQALNKAIAVLDENPPVFMENQQILQIDKNIQLINSFYIPISDRLANDNDYTDWLNNQDNHNAAAAPSMNSDWIKDYNVVSYKWEGRTGFSNFWAKLFGKDHSREQYFNSDRRVKLVAFDVNYGFYASSGVKVEMEQRKKFLFIKYWVDCTAANMAVGFHQCTGELTLNNASNGIDQNLASGWNAFTGYFNNVLKNFIYRGFFKIDFIKDFSSEVHTFIPEIPIKIPKVDLDKELGKIAKDIINAPADQVYNFLKGLTGKYVYEPVKKQIQSKDPRVLYVQWSSCKIASYVHGLKGYGTIKNKTIRFDRSFGFTIKITSGGTSVNPFLPSYFDIKNLDVFGAAKYNGVWKGVRFYGVN
jgi:hypothetical protein